MTKRWGAFGTMRADQKIPISLMGICVLYRRDPQTPTPLKDWEAFGTMRADQKIPISLMGIVFCIDATPLTPFPPGGRVYTKDKGR